MLFWNRRNQESAGRFFSTFPAHTPDTPHVQPLSCKLKWTNQVHFYCFLLKPIRDNLAPGFPRTLDLSPLHAQKSSGSRLTSSPADRASRFCAHAGKENRGILVPNATWLSFFLKDGGGKRKFNSSASSSQNSDLRVEENG